MQTCIILFYFLIDLSPLLLAKITCSWRQRLRRKRSTSQLLHPPPPPPQGIARSICRSNGLPWRRPDKIPYIQVETILLILQTQRALFIISSFKYTSHTNITHPNLHPSPLHHVVMTSRLGAGLRPTYCNLPVAGAQSKADTTHDHNYPSQGVGFFQPLFRGAVLKKYQGEVESPRPGKRRLILLWFTHNSGLFLRTASLKRAKISWYNCLFTIWPRGTNSWWTMPFQL